MAYKLEDLQNTFDSPPTGWRRRNAGAAGTAIMAVGVLGFVMFALPFFAGIVSAGSIAGCIIFAVVFFYGMRFHPANARIANLWKTTGGKIALCVAGAFACALVALCLVGLAKISEAENRVPADDATVVVLGCKVNGTKPSLSMRTRLDAAHDYLIEHPDAMCIVTGGKGDGEVISEAECMYNDLVGRGISPQRILIEDESTTTRENIENARRIIKEHGLNENLAIATSGYHEFRAQSIAGRLGLESGAISAETPWWLQPSYVMRELLCIPIDAFAPVQ